MGCQKKCGCETTKKGKVMVKEFSRIPNPGELKKKLIKSDKTPELSVTFTDSNIEKSTYETMKTQTAPETNILSKSESFFDGYFTL